MSNHSAANNDKHSAGDLDWAELIDSKVHNIVISRKAKSLEPNNFSKDSKIDKTRAVNKDNIFVNNNDNGASDDDNGASDNDNGTSNVTKDN